jgi:hypothetical protein
MSNVVEFKAITAWAQSLQEDMLSALAGQKADLGVWTCTVVHSTSPENFGAFISSTGWQKLGRLSK